MTAPVRPTGVKYYLRSKWIYIPSGSYDPAAPSTALLVGATALDVTKMLYASSATPTQSTNLPKAPKRVGDAEMYEQIGDTNVSFGELRYAFDPQAAAASTGKKAAEKLLEAAAGYMVNRLGIDRVTDLAIGQFVTSYPVLLGPQLEVPEGDAEGAEVAIVQTCAQTGPKSLNVALLA
jgi:hypothetical protein